MSQLDYMPEKDLPGQVKSISVAELIKLSEIAKKRICKIKLSNGGHGTGFFCTIDLDNWNLMRTLITNNHVLKADDIIPGKKIKFSMNDEAKNYEIKIDKVRRTYTNRKYDILNSRIRRDKMENKIIVRVNPVSLLQQVYVWTEKGSEKFEFNIKSNS